MTDHSIGPVAVASIPFHPASSLDYVPREQLRELQSQRLRRVVSQACEHAPLFRQRLQKQGLAPADIREVDDIARLPLSTVHDLSPAHPLHMLAVPMTQVARLVQAAGAGGPAVTAYTRRDLEARSEIATRCLAACGIRAGDVIQADGRHHLGLCEAVAALGATVILVADRDVDRQVALMKDLGVTAICCTPNHFLRLARAAEKTHVKLSDCSLRAGAFLAERWHADMRRSIEQCAGIQAYDVAGVWDVLGAVGVECHHRNGPHVFEDHFFPEVVDPGTGAPLPAGQRGELVLTTLTMEAMPWIRFRTGQTASLIAEPCACGRTARRIQRIAEGEEVCAVQGVPLYPSQIESAIRAVQRTPPRYQIVLTDSGGLEQIEVRVEITPQILGDRVGPIEESQDRLEREIEHLLGVSVGVRFVEPHTLERDPAGARLIVDNRRVVRQRPPS